MFLWLSDGGKARLGLNATVAFQPLHSTVIVAGGIHENSSSIPPATAYSKFTL